MNQNYNLINLENYRTEFKILDEINSELSILVYCRIKTNSVAYNLLDTFISDIQERQEKLKDAIDNLSNSNQSEIIDLNIETNLFKQLQTKRTEFDLDSINETIEYLVNYQNDDIYFNKLTKVKKASSEEFDIEKFKNTKFKIAIAQNVDQIIVYKQDDIHIKNNDIYLDLNYFDVFSQNNLRYLLFSHLFNLHDINSFLKIMQTTKSSN